MGAPSEPNSCDLTAEQARCVAMVREIFPDPNFIEPAEAINPDWCFRIQAKNGDMFLAWIDEAHLSGLTKADREGLYDDFEQAKALKHPNILAPLHMTQKENFAIVITDDFSGKPLLGMLNDQSHSLELVKTIFYGLANAMEAAHEAGVLHRALNPVNILIDESLGVRVFGFGMANVFFDRWLEMLRASGRRKGDYIAPELLTAGLKGAEPHCEVFSIGRVIFELITGQLPKNSVTILPSKVSDAPAYMDDTLLNSMHGNPEIRPQSIGELREKFDGMHQRQLGSDGSFLNDSSSRQQGSIFDGHLSFLSSDWFKFGAAIFILAAIIGAVVKMKQPNPQTETVPVVLTEKRLTVGKLLDEWRKWTKQQLKDEYNKDPDAFEKVVYSSYQHLTTQDKFDESRQFLRKVADVGDAQYSQRVKSWLINIDLYNEMLRLAREARSKGEALAEESALARAVELFPTSESAKELYRSNPQRIAAQLSASLVQLKEKNPDQESWHYDLRVTYHRVCLDLSGHQSLTDLSPLKGQVIHELNLSETGIDSLHRLIGMPLDELRIDRTAVTDTTPLMSMPLRVLTFLGTPLENVEQLKRIGTLHCLLGNDKGRPFSKILPPHPDQPTWINGDGLKFRGLKGLPVFLAEKEFIVNREILTNLTFEDAKKRCMTLTQKGRKSKEIGHSHRYRLPTDGEWSLAAELPESPFLSPRGRRLQRLTESDLTRHRQADTILEVSEGGAEIERATVGFFGLENEIGEWVEDGANRWTDHVIVRGISDGSELKRLRYRAKISPHTAAKMIGFRPALEIDITDPSKDPNRELNPFKVKDVTKLAQISLDPWKNAHLRAAANSSLTLKNIANSASYRKAFIAAAIRDTSPESKKRYLRVDLALTWSDAKGVAQQVGGRLATADSREKIAWLQERFVNQHPLGTPLWMGASAFPRQLSWVWESRENVARDLLPEPAENDKRSGALLVPVSGNTGSGKMVAQPVTELHSFLIEWDEPEKDLRAVADLSVVCKTTGLRPLRFPFPNTEQVKRDQKMWGAKNCLVNVLIGSPMNQIGGHSRNRSGQGRQNSPDRCVESGRNAKGGQAETDAGQKIEQSDHAEKCLGQFRVNMKNYTGHSEEICRGRPGPTQSIDAVACKRHHYCCPRNGNGSAMSNPQSNGQNENHRNQDLAAVLDKHG